MKKKRNIDKKNRMIRKKIVSTLGKASLKNAQAQNMPAVASRLA